MAITRRAALTLAAGAVAAPYIARAAGLRTVETADTVVIGAGLSGLNAALLLEEQGQKVIVLEGRNRAGGRLYTMDDVPGHPEAGGSGIGGGYARLIDRTNTLGVTLVPQRVRTEASPGSTLIHLRGQNILPKDWEASALNPYTGERRKRLPWLQSFSGLGPFNPLPEAAAWRAPEMAANDVSVAAFLIAKGWTPDELRMAYATNPSYGNSAQDVSALMWWHIGKNAELMAGQGGGAMAKAVKAGVRYNTPVVAIRAEGGMVEAITADGSRYRGKSLVCSLPASALRLVRIEPALPVAQQAGIDLLPYNRVFQAHFVPTRKFWEADGLPASMWTDTLAGRFMGLRYGDDPNEVTSFLAFVNGFAADRLDRMDPQAAAAAVLADVEAARPAAKGALRLVKTWSWARDPFAGGAYACWLPGQIASAANEFPKPAGRLFFAGEHTAAVARGMEGAMESGERAALEVLS